MMVAKRGAARRHIGTTMRGVIAVLEPHGLDPFAQGFICYHGRGELREIWNEEGEVVQEVHFAGNRYSFCMDEVAFFIVAGEREARRQSEIKPLRRIGSLARAVGLQQ